MNQVVDRAVVLKRQDFGEADRIVTFLTKNSGKITGMVKGARRPKSKMSGGIELFSLSSITFLAGKGDIKTVVSTRLDTHFGNITQDINRTMWAYEALKFLDKTTEEACEPAYYSFAGELFEALNNLTIPLEVVRLWFDARLLSMLGHGVNTETDAEGRKLQAGDHFHFAFETMAFVGEQNGSFNSDHIKVLRLVESQKPEVLARIQGAGELATALIPIIEQGIRLWVH